MVTIISNSKYRLSKMGGSTEVILFCHGSWTTGDGKLYVPEGMVIHFYSAHGQFGSKGIPIANALIGATDNDASLDNKVLAALFERKVAEKWSDDRLDQEILNAKGEANSKGTGESMDIYESVRGKGLGHRQKVYNYFLGYDGPSDSEARTESLYRNHAHTTTMIDVMIMQKGATGHLASAIKFARSEGEKYQVFHFLPCRYVRSDDKKAQRTVTDRQDFGDAEFKVTSL